MRSLALVLLLSSSAAAGALNARGTLPASQFRSQAISRRALLTIIPPLCVSVTTTASADDDADTAAAPAPPSELLEPALPTSEIEVPSAQSTSPEAGAEMSSDTGATEMEASPPEYIEYAVLKQRLNECREERVCDITRAEFTDSKGESGFAYIGTRRLTIRSIPADNPTNDSSPYRLVASLRDANVPFTFPYSDLSQFRGSSSWQPQFALPALPTTMPALPTKMPSMPTMPTMSALPPLPGLPTLPF